MKSYNLYHTLKQNIPPKKFTVKQKTDLAIRHSLLDENGKEAFLMLICEHARVQSQYQYDSENPKLPYGGVQKGKNVIFIVEKFPSTLKWILLKFLNVACKKEV